MAQEVTVLDDLDTASHGPLHLRHPRRPTLSELKIHQLRRILRDHPGESPVFLHLGANRARSATPGEGAAPRRRVLRRSRPRRAGAARRLRHSAIKND
jgi:hypothetical protein